MSKLNTKIRSLENFKALKDYLPTDHSKRQSLTKYVKDIVANKITPTIVLDLGCGEGTSLELFKLAGSDCIWHGVDIEHSPEVRRRTLMNNAIKTFDGINLPYPDQSFDLIYCNQVLEHVRYPDKLIAETLRILKPDGLFIGSVSYLEPFHSLSIFNFTPYGVVRVFEDAGFKVEEIRPGKDASLLISRSLFNRSDKLRYIWNCNYLHALFSIVGRLTKLGHAELNFLKVQFAGHLVFRIKLKEQNVGFKNEHHGTLKSSINHYS